MRDLWREIRQAAYAYSRRPALTAVVSLTLALAVAATTIAFSCINSVLLTPLPFHEPERLARVAENDLRNNFEWNGLRYRTYEAWRDRADAFEGLSLFQWNTYDLTGAGDAISVSGFAVQRGHFSLLGVAPLLGRTFTAEEDAPGAPARVVVLGQQLWRDRFGADPDILDRTIEINAQPYRVVGVMPRAFDFGYIGWGDLWTPLGLDPAAARQDFKTRYFSNARVRVGLSEQQVRERVGAVSRQLEHDHPETNAGWGLTFYTFPDYLLIGVRPVLLLLFACVALTLLAACSNIVSLLLVRTIGRQREIAVRLALGAGQGGILRQTLVESAVLVIPSIAVALLLTSAGVRALVYFVTEQGLAQPPYLARMDEIAVDYRVLLFTLGLTSLLALALGLVPWLASSRLKLSQAVREGDTRSSSGAGAGLLRDGLTVVEAALATVLLAGAGLMYQSVAGLMDVDLGFQPEGVLTASVYFPDSYFSVEQRRQHLQSLLGALNESRQVDEAGAVARLPLWGQPRVPVRIVGQPQPPPGEEPRPLLRRCTSEYVQAMRVRLVAGRLFNPSETWVEGNVALINERMARLHWANEDPLNRQVRLLDASGQPGPPLRVIGVVGDERAQYGGLEKDADPAVYVPFDAQPPSSVALTIRTNGDPQSAVAVLRERVRGLADNVVLSDTIPMPQLISQHVAPRRFALAMMGALAALAWILAAVGIYSVMSHNVVQRRREFGVRAAIGAQPRDLSRLVLTRGMRLVLLGLALGAASAWGLARFASGMLFGVSAGDPLTLVAVALTLIATAWLACYLPARRSSRVSPVVALRSE
ncbi:MAG: ABC transporter permease [Acidobacteria bacterium]|nr:ABC transporter permease [Acidobacteriota bacterium]